MTIDNGEWITEIHNSQFSILNSQLQSVSDGGYSSGATPVPIPNTEVKPARADGTAWATVWKSRSPPSLTLFLFYSQPISDILSLQRSSGITGCFQSQRSSGNTGCFQSQRSSGNTGCFPSGALFTCNPGTTTQALQTIVVIMGCTLQGFRYRSTPCLCYDAHKGLGRHFPCYDVRKGVLCRPSGAWVVVLCHVTGVPLSLHTLPMLCRPQGAWEVVICLVTGIPLSLHTLPMLCRPQGAWRNCRQSKFIQYRRYILQRHLSNFGVIFSNTFWIFLH